MSQTSYSIDWFSFSVPLPAPTGGGGEGSVSEVVFDRMYLEYGSAWCTNLLNGLVHTGHGRAPYKHHWRNDERGVSVFAGGDMPHFTIEVSGRGCRWLEHNELTDHFCHTFHDRMSRIDIAVDIGTDVRPKEFATTRTIGRAQTFADMTSPSGETCYVGSMHSERYARVYRYNNPHPRSHLLRVEHVFRRNHAKAVASAIVHEGLASVVAGCFATFGWQHPCADLDTAAASDLSVMRPERNGGKTLYWLTKQVAPAFHRLVQEGVIDDPVQFLLQVFLAPLQLDDDGKLY